MAVDEELLAEALRAAERIDEALRGVLEARAAHQRAVRALYLDGASMREIADRLGLSHQRVHQLLDVPKPESRWRNRGQTGGRGPLSSRGQLECQFCGRSQAQVRRLVAGAGTAICNACVVLGQNVLHAGEQATRDAYVRLAVQPGEGTCAFCGKHTGVPRKAPHREPLALVVAPVLPGTICTECLALALEIIDEVG
jgi:hypothetical protein